MNIKVSLQEKFDFVNMLLKKYKFKVRESSRIFTYLLENPHYLNLVHFVDDITNCPRAIIISTTCVLEEPFIFHKANVTSTNGLQAFHDIRLNDEEQIFIKVNFSDKNEILYNIVLEENPFINHTHKQINYLNTNNLQLQLHNKRVNILRQKVDEALDNNNKAEFDYLVKQLKALTEEKLLF